MAYNESLKAAIEAVQTLIGAITGVASAPASPADSPSGQWPTSIAFPRRGAFSGGANAGVQGLHAIVVQLHYPRADLARAYSAVVPYVELIAEALLDDPTLGGAVTTVVGDVGYTFGAMSYAGIDTLGWEFDVSVKVRYTEES